MDQNRRDSDLSCDLYLSLYGNNRKLKPQRIKAYAIYKKLIENTKSVDNFVIAANDTNEISVSFHGGSDCKVFTFDKLFYSDVSQTELSDSVAKSAIQDVIMGVNNFLIACKLASPYITRPLEDKISLFDMDCIDNLTINLLKELLLFAKTEENMDSSIHVSYFEVHDDKIIDLLSSCHEYRDMKVFENTEQNCIEVQDLVEKPLVDEKDIFELFRKQSYSLVCYASCCHSILSVSLVTKNINSDGFENIKVGKLTVAGFAKCKNSFLGDASKNSDDCLQKFAENHELPTSLKSKIFDILKPAFGGNAKTSIIVVLSSVLYSLEKDLSILQFVSEIRKTLNYPEIDLKLIIPNSLKEYAEEIKDLQKEFNATSKSSGIMLENLMYRFYKNSLSLENEKVKTMNNQLFCLTDAMNAKKQQLISLHTANETKEKGIKEVEKSSENLKLDLEKMEKENNVKQKASLKADEIIAMKQMKITYELYRKKLKLELIKTNRNYEELARNIHCLKGEMTSLLCDIDAEKTSLRSTLELLMVDMNNTLSNFQTLEENLFMKLTSLSDIDDLLKMWKQNIENLLSKFSSFLHEHDKNFNAVKLEMNSLVPLHTSQIEILEIIRNNRKEKGPVLSYYFGKVQIFCDSSFKILAEIMHQIGVIQSCYKAELKAIGAALFSSSQAFKKFHDDISISLKSFQQYFEEQEKELLQVTDMIYFHHKFKKQFDEKIGSIKLSLLALKQMCLGHNDATVHKWNEVEKDCHKTMQKHLDLSEHLSVIYKEMFKYIDNLAQQKLNTLEYSPLKDKTDNVESRMYQLLQIHKEMKEVIGEAFEVHKKGIDKEILEVKEYMNSQKAEVEKYFDTYSLKLKASLRYFLDELKSIQEVFLNNKDELKKNLDSLLSSISCLTAIYNNYKSVSSSILEKSERSFKIMPPVSEDKNDNMPDFDSLILDEWNVVTSTPNIPEKKELNLSYEKEKLLCRMKSVVEQQISQKLNISVLGSEGKENKSYNTSTVSLPCMSTHSKVPIVNFSKKNFSKLKFTKK